MYLLDTNIWLELLLQQARAQEVQQLLTKADPAILSISDFSLHSICVIFGRKRRLDALDLFLADLFVNARLRVRAIESVDLRSVTAVMQRHNLDFDDAYQYAICKSDGLELVSFDADFDRTDLVRIGPADVFRGHPP